MKLNLIFFFKFFETNKHDFVLKKNLPSNQPLNTNIFKNRKLPFKKNFKKTFFLKILKKKIKGFFFLNKFIQYFLENFFKKKILINIKKGSNKISLKQVSNFYFFNKFFKKNLKVSKQIVGILYYSIILKDSFIFSNFFKKKFEKINIKLHKKLLLGLK